MANKIAVEGIDGAGKTSVVDALAQKLNEEGLQVVTFPTYRLVNADLGFDIYELWRQDPLHAIKLVQATLDSCEQITEEQAADVAIYDRHWMTSLSEIGHNSDLVNAWGDYYVPTALLQVSIKTAREHCANDLDEPWMSKEALYKAAANYRSLARQYGKHLLGIYRTDSDVSPDDVAANIIWDMRIQR